MSVGVAGGWLPTTTSGSVVPVRQAVARVTAMDPGAFLDGEPWTFEITFTDPGTSKPTDLTGSRLYVQFCTGTGYALQTIQICDSQADDNSLTITDAVNGKATFNALPEARTWTAPFFGQSLMALPSIVYGDVYRQVGGGEAVGLTRITLRILPSTGRPLPPLPPPIGSKLDFSNEKSSALLALFPFGLPTNVSPPPPTGVMSFSDPTNNGVIALLPFGAA